MTHKQELNFRQSVFTMVTKAKKRGGMKKNCSSPEILGKRAQTERTEQHLPFPLRHPLSSRGRERGRESDHCRMQHRACHRFVPFDFLLAVTLFLNITVFVHVHSCVQLLGAFWLSLFLPPHVWVCVCVLSKGCLLFIPFPGLQKGNLLFCRWFEAESGAPATAEDRG